MDTALKTQIRSLVQRSHTWLDEGDHTNEVDDLLFATRDNGNVGDETPGAADFKEARRVAQLVEASFPQVQTSVESVDEWVELAIFLR